MKLTAKRKKNNHLEKKKENLAIVAVNLFLCHKTLFLIAPMIISIDYCSKTTFHFFSHNQSRIKSEIGH